MKNISESIFYFTSGHGRGWAFSFSDLAGRFARQQIDNALSDLAETNKIRRVARGLYDYPRFSDLLQKTLSPDIDQVAYAYARKFSWRIEVSGESALNLLGLSTQIPAQYVYLCDGPSKSYNIMGATLSFKKSSLKDIGFKHRESTLIVQALKALGKEHLTESVFAKMREQIDEKSYPKILRDTQGSTGWIYEAIKQICQAQHGVKSFKNGGIMFIDELKHNKSKIEALAKQYGARHIRVFGSVARCEERPDSDVDFLVELPRGYDLFAQRIPLTLDLEKLLRRKVELVPEHELSRHIRDRVLSEAVEL